MKDQPTRAERFRPAELVGLAFALALFAGIVVLVSTRDLTLGVIALGIAFIVTLVVLAMLALVAPPGAPSVGDADPDESSNPANGDREG